MSTEHVGKAGTTLRLTPAQLARLEAAGWRPGSGALEEWVVGCAEEAARLRALTGPVARAKPEERALAAGWILRERGWGDAAGHWHTTNIAEGSSFHRYHDWFGPARWSGNAWIPGTLAEALDAEGVPR